MSAYQCPMMVAFSQKGTARLLYCGRWSCSICRVSLAKEWARIAKYGVWKITEAGGECLFWTLTMGSEYTQLTQAYEALPRLWNTLRMAIERDQKRFFYLAFAEGQPQRDMMPHLHTLVFAHVPDVYNVRTDPRENIKDFAVACGFGHQAKEKLISSDGAARYVAKYASKDGTGMPKGFRRVRASRAWPRPPIKPFPPYIVRSYGEPISDYLLRVEATTPRTMDEIVEQYTMATYQLENERGYQ